MARMHGKARHEEHENHERWLVSYADFITLLFAFFVVMYSISQVNEGKYRVLSDALMAAFSETPRALEPIQIGDIVRSPGVKPDNRSFQPTAIDAQTLDPVPVPLEPQRAEATRGAELDAASLKKLQEQVAAMSAEVERALAELVQQGQVIVRRKPLWMEVEFNTNTLFRVGSVDLPPASREVLGRLAEVLRPFPARLHVEGFTDDLPISTPAYPSNWELSAARAASVVHLFAGTGVDPRRMAAIGYGEYRPVADNATEAGRARNRRVVVVVLPDSGNRRTPGGAPELLREELEQLAAPTAQPEAAALPVPPQPEAVPSAADAAPAPSAPATLSEERGWQ